MRRTIIGAAAGLALALGACSGGEDDASDLTGQMPSQDIADAGDLGLPAEFAERTQLPDCGEATLGQGEGMILPPEAVACLEAGGEYLLLMPTTEGALIAHWYRHEAGADTATLFIDYTKDQFGPGGWTRQECRGEPMTVILGGEGCSKPVDLGGAT